MGKLWHVCLTKHSDWRKKSLCIQRNATAVCESFAPITTTMSIQVHSDNIHSSVKVHTAAWTDLETSSSKSKWKQKVQAANHTATKDSYT